jgi:hypothetical protein
VPEDAPAWGWATSTRDNCLGGDCPHHKACFVLKARKKALEADLVVVNHHLFFADVWLKDEGAGELLPASNAVIFDEAHQLPATASLFFGETVTTGMLLDLCRDVRVEAAVNAADFAELPQTVGELEIAAQTGSSWPGAGAGAHAGGTRPGAQSSVPHWMKWCARWPSSTPCWKARPNAPTIWKSCTPLPRSGRPHRTLAVAAGPASESPIPGHRALAGSRHAFRAVPCHAVECRGTVRAPDRGGCQRLDIHLRHLVGAQGFLALPARNRPVKEAETAVWDSPFDYPGKACCTCRKRCPTPTRRAIPKPWWKPPGHCWKPAAAVRSCCSPRCAP